MAKFPKRRPNIEPNLDPYKVLNNYLLNTANLATPFNKFGHFKSTVTGFEGEVLLDGGQNIDYILHLSIL